MPGFITKEMIKEKKKQIVKAEKQALLNEFNNAATKEPEPEAKRVEPEFLKPKKTMKGPTAEELALEQKRKMAEAIKAVIKGDKEDKERLAERKVGIVFYWKCFGNSEKQKIKQKREGDEKIKEKAKEEEEAKVAEKEKEKMEHEKAERVKKELEQLHNKLGRIDISDV